MATKWKELKKQKEPQAAPEQVGGWRNSRLLGWVSFFLGVSLLLTVGTCFLGPRAAADAGDTSYYDLLQTDVKDTNLFRQSVLSTVNQMSRVQTNGKSYDDSSYPYSFHGYKDYAYDMLPFPCAAAESGNLIYQFGDINYSTLKANNFQTDVPLLTVQIKDSVITQVTLTQASQPDNLPSRQWAVSLRNMLLNYHLADLTDYSGHTEKTFSIQSRTVYLAIPNHTPFTEVYQLYTSEKHLYNTITDASVLLLSAAVLLLVLSALAHAGKYRVENIFSEAVGNIPAELKLVVLAVLCFLPLFLFFYQSYNGWGLTLFRMIFLLLWYVWLAYFLFNDLRFHTFARRSLLRTLWQRVRGSLRSESEKTPLAKQIQRWLLPLYIVVDICAILCYLFLMAAGGQMPDSLFFFSFVPLSATLALVFYLEYRCWKKCEFLGLQMAKLTEQIRLLRSGAQPQPIHVGGCEQLSAAAYDLNDLQGGIEEAVNQRVRSERMKVELVTNVSHDLKTPLTSIISYVDLLQEEELSPTARDYVQILAQKSDRLKAIVQDVFDVSKAVSGNLAVNFKTLDLAKLLRQTLADMDEQIAAAPVTFRTQLPDRPVWIHSDGDRLYRVFQNLFQNAAQYSLENSRIFVTLTIDPVNACVRIRNTSKYEIGDAQALLERFTRGDKNRTTEGSGLGLSIAQSFTQACGGRFSISAQADLFTAEVVLPLGQPPKAESTSANTTDFQ